ncbi:hypothetical protein RB195_017260 [Necator americanus]|uniref:Uncharacterized protein n=1 Tax=Necator americanus TaxID=51031 RepID=A0ABR1C7K2_NECAM
MAGIVGIIVVCFSIRLVLTSSSDAPPRDPFVISNNAERSPRTIETTSNEKELLSSANNWGFVDDLTEWPENDAEMSTKNIPEKIITTTPYYEEVDPDRNGLLKDIGTINVGFGVGVGVPGNDPVRVGSRVGVGFGASGLAGKLPIGEDIYPRQGEWQSLNDYDGNKANIVPDRARKYWQAVREGRIKIPHYRPASSLVGVGGNIGVG